MDKPIALLIDAIVIIAYFVVIVGIGLKAGRSNKNLRDYAVGGRSIPWWAVLASIIAAETSAATFLGAPAEGYSTRSYSYAQLAIGTVLARVIIAFLFIAPYYKYRVQSIYEFLDLRFGPATKNAASGIFLITRVLGIGVRLYLGGVILVVIWRYFGHSVSLNTYFWGILFVTVVTTIYTAVGGIKAVVWTDLIQACLMMGAVLFAIFTLFHHIPGGWGTVTETMKSNPGVGMFQSGWDASLPFGAALKGMLEQQYTLLAAFLGSTFFTMATHGTDQDMVQRMLTAENPKKSKFSLILSGLADIPIVLAFLSVGILLYVYYLKVPDGTLPKEDNEVFAHYIVNEMPIAVRGLIIAGVFATMMGSTSAALNALATSFVRDFFQPYLSRKDASEEARERGSIVAARWSTVVFGALMVVVATLCAYAVLQTNITIIPLALGILGYSYGALLGMFLLGVLTKKRGHDIGNVIAMVCGISAVLILCKVSVPFINLGDLFSGKGLVPGKLSFGWFMPEWWPAFAWPYYVLIGSVVSFLIAACFPCTRVMPEYVTEDEPVPASAKGGMFH